MKKDNNKLAVQSRILFYYMIGYSGGGSDQSLFSHLLNLDKDLFFPIVVYREESNLVHNLKTKNIFTIKQRFFASSFKVNKKQKIKIPGSKTLIFNFKVILEAFLLIKVILKYKIDIIHLNNSIKSNRACAIAGILLRKKVIVHDRMGFNLDVVDKLLLKYVDQIITISDEVKKTYQNLNYLESKITVIHNGIDTELFKPQEFINNNNLIIGSVGRLVDWKGVDVLLNAVPLVLEKYPECRFIIAGEGREEGKLKRLASHLKIENKVEFRGNVENIVEFYYSIDIFVHTAIEPEPFGRVIIEAMACGLPVISTNIGGPKEIIIQDEDGILIPPNDSKLLAEKILFLIHNNHLRLKFSKNAVNTARSKFNSLQTTKNIDTIYSKLLL